MGVMHLENAAVSGIIGFQAWPVSQKAVKWDCSKKKSLACAFYTFSVVAVLGGQLLDGTTIHLMDILS